MSDAAFLSDLIEGRAMMARVKDSEFRLTQDGEEVLRTSNLKQLGHTMSALSPSGAVTAEVLRRDKWIWLATWHGGPSLGDD